jgi:hypothetical protein
MSTSLTPVHASGQPAARQPGLRAAAVRGHMRRQSAGQLRTADQLGEPVPGHQNRVKVSDRYQGHGVVVGSQEGRRGEHNRWRPSEDNQVHQHCVARVARDIHGGLQTHRAPKAQASSTSASASARASAQSLHPTASRTTANETGPSHVVFRSTGPPVVLNVYKRCSPVLTRDTTTLKPRGTSDGDDRVTVTKDTLVTVTFNHDSNMNGVESASATCVTGGVMSRTHTSVVIGLRAVLPAPSRAVTNSRISPSERPRGTSTTTTAVVPLTTPVLTATDTGGRSTKPPLGADRAWATYVMTHPATERASVDGHPPTQQGQTHCYRTVAPEGVRHL